MARVIPFQALRADVNKVDKIAALPYDVYNLKEARNIVKSNSLSFLQVDKPDIFCSDDQILDSYNVAKNLLYRYLSDGLFVRENKRCYYIYELTMNDHVQTGVVGCVSIDDYINGVVRTHESTRIDKEQDRINHVRTCSAQTGPIFMIYRAEEKIKKIIKHIKIGPSLYDFKSNDGVRHRVWKVDNEREILFLQICFNGIKKIYIADGHHRAAAAVKVGLERRNLSNKKDFDESSDYFMSVLFPDDEVKVFPYNRIIRDTQEFSCDDIIDGLNKNFIVEKVNEPYVPNTKGSFGMYLSGKWYRFTFKNNIFHDNVLDMLDVSILQKYVFLEIFGVTDMRNDQRMNFVSGAHGIDVLEKKTNDLNGVGFAMKSVEIDDIMNVADAGLCMPPKSTWFEPKLRSGMFVHLI